MLMRSCYSNMFTFYLAGPEAHAMIERGLRGGNARSTFAIRDSRM